MPIRIRPTDSLHHAFPSLGGDLAEEDARFAAYLEQQGWEGEMGITGTEALVDSEEMKE